MAAAPVQAQPVAICSQSVIGHGSTPVYLRPITMAGDEVAPRLLRLVVNLVVQVEFVAHRHGAVDRVKARALLHRRLRLGQRQEMRAGNVLGVFRRVGADFGRHDLDGVVARFRILQVIHALVVNRRDLGPFLLVLRVAASGLTAITS